MTPTLNQYIRVKLSMVLFYAIFFALLYWGLYQPDPPVQYEPYDWSIQQPIKTNNRDSLLMMLQYHKNRGGDSIMRLRYGF